MYFSNSHWGLCAEKQAAMLRAGGSQSIVLAGLLSQLWRVLASESLAGKAHGAQ